LTSSLIGGVGRDAEYIAKHIASLGENRRPSVMTAGGQPAFFARPEQ
jgi:hypothetical protein